MTEVNAIATVDTTTGEVLAERPDQSATVFQPLYNTIDTTTRAGKVKTVNAYNNAGSLTELGDKVFTCVDAFTTTGIRRSRVQGAPDVECINAYLITDDGNSYFTQSSGIVNGLQMVLAVAPDLDRDDGGIKLRVTSKKLANGNTLKGLEIVE